MCKFNWMTNACAVFLLWAAAAVSLPAQTYNTLDSFDGTDGEFPEAGLIQGPNGMLYGTTHEGGANDYGVVFSITTGGALTMLHSFDGTDGSGPYGGLVLGSNGIFYGTTSGGGAYGYGTVFSITAGGTLTTLHSFGFNDGAGPYAGLIQGTNGALYGTTLAGGANIFGTVFSITTSGTLTTLYNFCQQSGCTDGACPYAGLIQGTNGTLYGTTYSGGANQIGTVFSITTGGTLTTLHSFDGTDGSRSFASLVLGTNGTLYGTTQYGGTNGYGTVFSITTGGTLTALHSFNYYIDGAEPIAGLVEATNGMLYGSTFGGGAYDGGTVFSITTGGTLTTLHSFGYGGDGALPYADLVQDTNGTLYGTTDYGGAYDYYGTVYSLAEGLGPFVSLVSTSGEEGAEIGILGQGFSSASVVKFHGVQATTVTVDSATSLKATVPAGAISGLVTVTTGGTTLISSQKFRVTPTISSFTPPSGPVGTPVKITGTGLLQTTKVTFNHVTATSVTINSDTQVTADVPTGATTGKIQITTPGGTATSATSFTVN